LLRERGVCAWWSHHKLRHGACGPELDEPQLRFVTADTVLNKDKEKDKDKDKDKDKEIICMIIILF
jgi:hypothetical protein